MTAMTSTVSTAMDAQQPGSPWAIPATVTQTSIEIAEVGSIANWRDEPNWA